MQYLNRALSCKDGAKTCRLGSNRNSRTKFEAGFTQGIAIWRSCPKFELKSTEQLRNSFGTLTPTPHLLKHIYVALRASRLSFKQLLSLTQWWARGRRFGASAGARTSQARPSFPKHPPSPSSPMMPAKAFLRTVPASPT